MREALESEKEVEEAPPPCFCDESLREKASDFFEESSGEGVED